MKHGITQVFAAVLIALSLARSSVAQNNPPPCALPQIYIEDGFDDGDVPQFPGSGPNWQLSEDDIWCIPNVFPMLRCDVRMRTELNGVMWFPPHPGVQYHRSPQEFAEDVANRVQWFFTQTASRWQQPNKPKHYAILLIGLDDGDVSCSLRLTRNFSDMVVGTQSHFTPHSSFFTENGRDLVHNWANDAFARLKQELDTRQLPMPSRLFTDFESRGDPRFFLYNGLGLLNLALADPRSGNERIDHSGASLIQWLGDQGRATDCNGQPIGSVNLGAWPVDTAPVNFGPVSRVRQAHSTAFFYALSAGLFEPFQTVFPGTFTGEWDTYTNTRLSPYSVRPTQRECHMNGYCGSATMLIPVNYSAPHGIIPAANGPCTTVPLPPEWECEQNWMARFPNQSWSADDVERYAQLGRLVGNLRVAELRGAVPTSVQIVPSISIAGDVDKIEKIPLISKRSLEMSKFIAESNVAGASAFYLWEPSYRSHPQIRTLIKQCILKANALRCGVPEVIPPCAVNGGGGGE